MYLVEMVNVFALRSELLQLTNAQCHCQRVEKRGSTGALISGLEINIYTYIHIQVYTSIYVL